MENNMLLKSYVNDDCDNAAIKQKINNIWATMKSQKKQELIISAYQLIANAMRNSNELTPIISKQSLVTFAEFDQLLSETKLDTQLEPIFWDWDRINDIIQLLS